ncbi:MAG: MoaD/ThiS family protein [Chthonomonas sp.]|nr:MoaD/ThiS family protein [Chthonomonas sp.]
MKTVTIRYFAVLRERRGLAVEQKSTSCETVGELVNALIVEHRLGLPPSLIRVAIGQEFVDPGYLLHEGCELVLIPPVAGG